MDRIFSLLTVSEMGKYILDGGISAFRHTQPLPAWCPPARNTAACKSMGPGQWQFFSKTVLPPRLVKTKAGDSAGIVGERRSVQHLRATTLAREGPSDGAQGRASAQGAHRAARGAGSAGKAGWRFCVLGCQAKPARPPRGHPQTRRALRAPAPA